MVLTITYWVGKLVSHSPVSRQPDLINCWEPIALLSMWMQDPILLLRNLHLYAIENTCISVFNSIFIYRLMEISGLELCLGSPQVISLTETVKMWCCFMMNFFSMAFFSLSHNDTSKNILFLLDFNQNKSKKFDALFLRTFIQAENSSRA